MPQTMCESAGLVSGLSPAKCDDLEMCRYHQGVEDASFAALEAVARRLDVRVYLAEAVNVRARFHNAVTGEVCEGPLGGLVSYIANALTRGEQVNLDRLTR